MTKRWLLFIALALTGGALASGAETKPPTPWTVGSPIATFYGGPPLTEVNAKQMAEAGFNLVWASDTELDTAHQHGMRAMLYLPGILTPGSLATPAGIARLNALIDRVKTHPALYAYYIGDEPSAAPFTGLGALVEHLRQRDPAHVAYINLYPNYASNQQLGTTGDEVTAYQEYLRNFFAVVKPALLSYDHYIFYVDDPPTLTRYYFLNMAMIRRSALDANIPWMNGRSVPGTKPYAHRT